jgi:hypothetical protein
MDVNYHLEPSVIYFLNIRNYGNNLKDLFIYFFLLSIFQNIYRLSNNSIWYAETARLNALFCNH